MIQRLCEKEYFVTKPLHYEAVGEHIILPFIVTAVKFENLKFNYAVNIYLLSKGLGSERDFKLKIFVKFPQNSN